MKTIGYIVTIILIVAIAYYLGYDQGYRHVVSPDYSEYEQKVDSLSRILDSIQIDTTKIADIERIRDTVYKEYQQKFIDMSQFDDAKHISFFSEYLSKNN